MYIYIYICIHTYEDMYIYVYNPDRNPKHPAGVALRADAARADVRTAPAHAGDAPRVGGPQGQALLRLLHTKQGLSWILFSVFPFGKSL